jgi:hypothetical protein
MLTGSYVQGPAILHFGGVKGKVLHALLRPGTAGHILLTFTHPSQELVKRSACPLSSDAYTYFGNIESTLHNQEVKAATTFLQATVIPKYRLFSCPLYLTARCSQVCRRHQRAVNCYCWATATARQDARSWYSIQPEYEVANRRSLKGST